MLRVFFKAHRKPGTWAIPVWSYWIWIGQLVDKLWVEVTHLRSHVSFLQTIAGVSSFLDVKSAVDAVVQILQCGIPMARIGRYIYVLACIGMSVSLIFQHRGRSDTIMWWAPDVSRLNIGAWYMLCKEEKN